MCQGHRWQGARLDRIFQSVATGYHSDSMRLCFLQPDFADKVCVSYFLVLGDVKFSDGEDGSGAFDAFMGWMVFTNTVWKGANEFVRATLFPDFCVWAFEGSRK